MVDVSLRCRCGAVTGTAHDVTPRTGIHLVCHCTDCRAFAHAIERPDILTAHGGTDIFQLTPKQVRLDVPSGQLSLLRLSEQGAFRWYTTCCNTPIGNTMSGPAAPFIGLFTVFMDLDDDARARVLGPARGVRGEMAINPPIPSTIEPGFSLPAVWRTIRFAVRGTLTGGNRPSPFFDDAGLPRVEPWVISTGERAAAYAAAGSPVPT